MTITFEYDMTPADRLTISRLEEVDPNDVTDEMIQFFAHGAFVLRLNLEDLPKGD